MTLEDSIHKHCRKYKYSNLYEDYWLGHLSCEIRDCVQRSAAPHHTRTRGSGGDDEPINLLALCTNHHTEVGMLGALTFASRYPEIRDKMQAAMERPR